MKQRIWALRRPKALDERRITHILSVVNFRPDEIKSDGGVRSKEGTASTWEQYGKKYKHMIIDIDDMDDEDILVHLPKAVRFIEEGLYPKDNLAPPDASLLPPPLADEASATPSPEGSRTEEADDERSDEGLGTSVPKFARLKLKPASARPDGKSSGAVYVHCAMGKSRSVTVVVAYLLWKYPRRFGRGSHAAVATGSDDDANQLGELAPNPGSKKNAARAAINAAIKWVQRSRPMADPNWGFRSQLQLWWEMGCPDDVERHPVYRRWSYQREVERSVECGMAPTTLRFEDEEPRVEDQAASESKAAELVTKRPRELKCRKCRRSLATEAFIVAVNHDSLERDLKTGMEVPCQHYFIEPLSWMRSTLEQAELEGRLVCPNGRCGASVGRYSWKGFKCSCGEWVTPAFSLQKARVDESLPTVSRSVLPPASIGVHTPQGSNL